VYVKRVMQHSQRMCGIVYYGDVILGCQETTRVFFLRKRKDVVVFVFSH
jgi:hypothetical protein